MCTYYSGHLVVVLQQSGATALHLAAKAGHTEVVRCLLLSGAEPDTLNQVTSHSIVYISLRGFSQLHSPVPVARSPRTILSMLLSTYDVTLAGGRSG